MTRYFPSANEWAQVAPEATGMSADRLRDAIEFAQASECDWPKSLYLSDGRYVGTAHVNDQPPHDQPIGIVRPRGGTSGLVTRGGRIVAEWGDTARLDDRHGCRVNLLGSQKLPEPPCGYRIRRRAHPVARRLRRRCHAAGG